MKKLIIRNQGDPTYTLNFIVVDLNNVEVLSYDGRQFYFKLKSRESVFRYDCELNNDNLTQIMNLWMGKTEGPLEIIY